MAAEQVAADLARYCRELESYLCQKNEGHLIRIVGPAFERVCSWAARGVPLRIAFRGIDRYCNRHSLKPGRQRPVRIEFCEADILDAFDEWRRALGITAASDASDEPRSTPPRKPTLSSHIERVIARLRTLALQGTCSDHFTLLLDRAVRELEEFSDSTRSVRGEARAHVIERLAALEGELTIAAIGQLATARVSELIAEAEAELAPFGSRLHPEARAKALDAAYHRLVREAYGLPTLRYE